MASTARSSVARWRSNKGWDTSRLLAVLPCSLHDAWTPEPRTVATPAGDEATDRWTVAQRGPTRSRAGRQCPADARLLARTGLVVVDGHAVGDRITLARQDEPARHLVILQRKIDVHVDLA